ncbi:ferrous iron transport protein B [Jingyaoa shaoxingensis]|uniref:Ferrous iron transport protein B n=1 Tax=Jingyaoa shaoxingensis TaxID=2763671 RepID=A0ABR7N716_9FIRM|nr:ferrous iron transport protein B [Jingyaoa shaoxingensis]MBC8572193.1 ferrous iron transport protein B [Jingyaoa shaoxingensis]
MKEKTIALLGQPNSGKSSVFNGLTGSHQHVGNWPGKTVEHKEGTFRFEGETYRVVDLPGSYSLSAGSDEEVITTDYIKSGEADLVTILVDSSQLERSLYMVADFIGIKLPVLLILNMMDVAEQKGIEIHTGILQEKLGIPVIGFVAAENRGYGNLKEQIAEALKNPRMMEQSLLMERYAGDSSIPFTEMIAREKGTGIYTREKQAILAFEKEDKNLMRSGRHKYDFIDMLLDGAVKKTKVKSGLERFDRKALGRHSGKWIAFGIILAGMTGAMLIASPIMVLGFAIPGGLTPLLEKLMNLFGVWKPLAELVCVVLPNVLAFTIAMAGFVLGVTFIFALIEDVGYMARISVVFNKAMERLGLQGKSVCSFLMSLGCNMAGVAGSRVIDSTGQRFLTMILVWSIPCGSTLSLAPMLASIFFGPLGSFLVLLFMLGITLGSMFLASKIFGRQLIREEDEHGIIMELPPYHKPKWGHIVRMTLTKAKDIFVRAFRVIFLVSVVFYLLSYSWFGNISIFAAFGQLISPVTEFFGMTWQMFMAYLSSMVTKESLLGVINALYNNSDVVSAAFNAKSIGMTEGMAQLLPQVINKPQALGFIMAIVFNVPCTMTVAVTFRENHSKKWIALPVLYYLVFSLILSCVFYHIGMLIW